MARIGMPLSSRDPDAPVAEHFGKARWLLVVEAPDRLDLVWNAGLDGRWVAETLAARGCTDVVARHMGPGALAHVLAAGMRAWQADERVTARNVAGRLAAGALRPMTPAAAVAGHLHRRHAHRRAGVT